MLDVSYLFKVESAYSELKATKSLIQEKGKENGNCKIQKRHDRLAANDYYLNSSRASAKV